MSPRARGARCVAGEGRRRDAKRRRCREEALPLRPASPRGATLRVPRARFVARPGAAPAARNSAAMITIKNASDIEGMRVAGRLAAQLLDFLTPHVRAGVSTDELDRLSHDHIVNAQGAVPAPLGYAPPGHAPYPKSICTSVNHQVCHGIPNGRSLKNGDILNVDVTVIKDGWHGDTSRMFVVGEGSVAARRLCAVAYETMWRGIEKVRPGGRVGDIGHAMHACAVAHGCSVVREFCGHGIGRGFHEPPKVLNYGKPGTGEELVPGMVITVEPMVNAGRGDISRMPDGWTIVSRDRSLSAQWEHTVLVTEAGCEILTLSAGAPPPPKFVAQRADALATAA